jgi:hypothetical protein
MPMPDDFNPNMPEPAEEFEEPDYDRELDIASLIASLAFSPREAAEIVDQVATTDAYPGQRRTPDEAESRGHDGSGL